MSGKLKKVVLFIRLSILLLLSRPFRPISLVNVDVKIGSKAIAKR